MPIRQTLSERFGFKQFLNGQQAVIETLLRPASAAAIFPTGAGKSLCYQLPALHLTGLTLVVSPLMSLMKDQVEFLTTKNIPAAKLDSSLSREEQSSTLRDARNGKLKILMVSVERFKNERFRLQLERMQISLMVVDEAHCISEWGHNFRPDYLKIPIYQKTFQVPHVLLLTATATPMVIKDMRDKFNIPEGNVFSTGFYRKNLHLNVIPSSQSEKDRLLVDALSSDPPGPSIVYVTQQKTTEKIAKMLSDKGMAAEPYHAGMNDDARQDVQNRFMRGQLGTVVATIAFGMGIDKSDIRKVIHYDLPKSIESYSQEIGRAGRDGNISVCCLLGDRSGVPILENFAYGDTPEKEGIKVLLEKVKNAHNKKFKVRMYELSRETDIRPLPLKTILVYLEIKKIIKPQYVYFEDYSFKFLSTEESIIGTFSGERKTFVETLFTNSKKARIWSTANVEATAGQTKSDRTRVIAALDYFEEKGWIQLKPKSSVEVFEVLNENFIIDEVTDWLFDLFIKREQVEIKRIHQMIRFFETSTCLSRSLSKYYGEKLDITCGFCSSCRSKEPLPFKGSYENNLAQLDFSKLTDELFENMDPPITSWQITRFLCGISTPRTSRAHAGRLRHFGYLATTPYKDVLNWVKQSNSQSTQNTMNSPSGA